MAKKFLKFQDVLQQELKGKDFRKPARRIAKSSKLDIKLHTDTQLGVPQEQLATRTAT